MGFGTLFIGYFLLLNITYYSYTDLISALVMAIGLYKLSAVNRSFKYAFYSCLAFAAVGAAELVLAFTSLFMPRFDEFTVLAIISIPRYTAIAAVTMMMLLGIRDVSGEVRLLSLYKKSSRSTIPSVLVYLLLAIFEIPQSFGTVMAFAIIAVILLLAAIIIVIINLTTIYTAYMKICMPDERDMKEKPRKSGIINSFREHSEQKEREYAEYKIQKMKEKSEKKRKR